MDTAYESPSTNKDSITDIQTKIDVERKRRFSIFSGNLKPIYIDVKLERGEQAYFQCQAERLADIDFMESHTTGTSKKKDMVGRALVGGFLMGGTGAVIGGLSGKDEINTHTSQERITKNEVVDEGALYLTNKRILFVGSNVVSIPFAKILKIESFIFLIIKYPGMTQGEQYRIADAKENKMFDLTYHGLMRMLKRDKSTPKESEVQVYASEFAPPPITEEEKKGKRIRKALIGIVAIVLLSTIFKPILGLLNILFGLSAFSTGFVAYFDKRPVIAEKRAEYKRIFMWSLVLFVLGLLVAFSQLTPETTPNPTITASPTPVVQVPTASPSPTPLPTPTPLDWIANPDCPLSVSGGFDMCLREKYPLKATIKADDLAVYVTNAENINWTDCRIDLADSSYMMNLYDSFSVPAKATTRVPWGRMADENGNRFNYIKSQPGSVDISCTENHELHQSEFSGF